MDVHRNICIFLTQRLFSSSLLIDSNSIAPISPTHSHKRMRLEIQYSFEYYLSDLLQMIRYMSQGDCEITRPNSL